MRMMDDRMTMLPTLDGHHRYFLGDKEASACFNSGLVYNDKYDNTMSCALRCVIAGSTIARIVGQRALCHNLGLGKHVTEVT